jgi:hypothetical protein
MRARVIGVVLAAATVAGGVMSNHVLRGHADPGAMFTVSAVVARLEVQPSQWVGRTVTWR